MNRCCSAGRAWRDSDARTPAKLSHKNARGSLARSGYCQIGEAAIFFDHAHWVGLAAAILASEPRRETQCDIIPARQLTQEFAPTTFHSRGLSEAKPNNKTA